MKILPNGIAVLEHDTHLSRWVEQQGRLCVEGAVYDCILPLISKGSTVIDAGAFLGDHTIAYADKVGPGGRVFAFEPNPKSFGCLVHNMKERPWVQCFNAALGNCRMPLSLVENPNVGAGYVVPGDGPRSKLIDDLQLEQCDFIHLDVEGFELFALQGGIATLSRLKPILVLEVNAGCLDRCGLTEADLFRFLSSLGYSWKPMGIHYSKEQYDIIANHDNLR